MKAIIQSKKHKDCLILNADYSPIAIIDWQKAMVWAYRISNDMCRSIEIVSYYTDEHIKTHTSAMRLPAVMRVSTYLSLHKKYVNFSRKNLFIRDDYMCQYCGIKYDLSHLTYDHVIPKSKWSETNKSPTNWTNIVTACSVCNKKKGNKTVKQANMTLRNIPTRPFNSPKYLPITHHLAIIKQDSIPKEWSIYTQ